MERRRRVVVVDLVRFVRDLQKHVTRTVHRVSSEQSTGRRGWFVHRGAFFREFVFSFTLSPSLYLYLFFVRVSIYRRFPRGKERERERDSKSEIAVFFNETKEEESATKTDSRFARLTIRF
jgi:hypothetical protein